MDSAPHGASVATFPPGAARSWFSRVPPDKSGETSTLRRPFPDHNFVSPDLPTEAEQAEKEPQSFLRRYPSPVIIDEVPGADDTVNLNFVRHAAGKSRIAGSFVVCRATNSYPLPDGSRAVPVTELDRGRLSL